MEKKAKISDLLKILKKIDYTKYDKSKKLQDLKTALAINSLKTK
jgi:hypothetical protein